MNNQQSPVEQVLQQTEVGSALMRYKNLLIGLAVAAILGVFVWGGYSHYASKNALEAQTIALNFTQNEVRSFAEGKLDAPALASGLKEVLKKSSSLELLPLTLAVSDLLLSRGKSVESLEVLEMANKEFASKNPYTAHFVLTRLAVAYEDSGKDKEAIEVLEKLNNSSLKILEGKNYLDLGRLYLKTGDKDKARKNLEHVVDKFASGDYSRMARIYLSEMGSTK